MNPDVPLICLITPGHVASTPRLVKEADALVTEGYRVHVVAGSNFSPADALDEQIISSAAWSCTRVRNEGMVSLYRKIRRKFSRLILANIPVSSTMLSAYAFNSEALHLGSVAARQHAQMYIGHCLAGLPAAALAGRSGMRPFGFDAEDFHESENDDVLKNRATRRAVHTLQINLLPQCAHLTAASPLICREYQKVFNLRPKCVLNVFPIAQAPKKAIDPAPISRLRPALFYWFSQTIGPGRGLESVVDILGRMQTPVELQLRGFASPGYVDCLQARATRAGLGTPIRVLPPGAPSEMARLAAHADVGLSTEERLPPNRDLCLTNKIFVYLLAGIPQLLSNTSAQTELAPNLGTSGILANLEETELVAARLDAFLGNTALIAAARADARERAFHRYCWDVEKTVFLDSIRSVVPI
jgi:hypothetical protein